MGRGFPANTSGPPPAISSSWLGDAPGLAAGDRPGYYASNVLCDPPPTASRFVSSALSFPRISRQSESTRWSWGAGIHYETVNCSSAAQVGRAVRLGSPVRVPAGLSTSWADSSSRLIAAASTGLPGVARCTSPSTRSEGNLAGSVAAQPSIRFPWLDLCSCRADVPLDFELASSRAGMGIELIARAVPLPGSIREVPISDKERRPVRASAVPSW